MNDKRCMIKQKKNIYFPERGIYGMDDLLDGDFQDIADRLLVIKRELGDGVRFDASYGWHGEIEYGLVYDRPETDKEQAARLKRAEANKKAAETLRLKKEKKERELLAKLQAKYGDSE